MGINLSNQMTSFATTLGKKVKLYRKLEIELLLALSVVNAHFICQTLTILIKLFRIKLVEALTKCQNYKKYQVARKILFVLGRGMVLKFNFFMVFLLYEYVQRNSSYFITGVYSSITFYLFLLEYILIE